MARQAGCRRCAGVPGIAKLLSISEQDVQSIIAGRANVGAAKWKQLQCAAAKASALARVASASCDPGHPNQAGSGRSVDPTVPTTTPTWTDQHAWCARLRGTDADRLVVMRQWCEAAGGRSVGDAIHLPASLPKTHALATLEYCARQYGLRVHTDPPAPSTTTGPFTTTTGPFTRAPSST